MNTTGLITVKAKIKIKTPEEGGLKSAFYNGYRPNHVFELPKKNELMTAHIGEIQFDEQKEIFPGETKIVTIRFLNTPTIIKYMLVGQKWFINEGARTIGFGEILEIES